MSLKEKLIQRVERLNDEELLRLAAFFETLESENSTLTVEQEIGLWRALAEGGNETDWSAFDEAVQRRKPLR